MPNTLLRQAYETAVSNPKLFRQASWMTDDGRADLAGLITIQAGFTVLEEAPVDAEPTIEPYVSNGQQVGLVSHIAASLTGITVEEGAVLWQPLLTLDQINHLIIRLEADEAIYETLSLPDIAYQHSWTRGYTIQTAAHRRTTFSRLGDTTQVRHHMTRGDALEYARAVAASRGMTYRDRHDIIGA